MQLPDRQLTAEQLEYALVKIMYGHSVKTMAEMFLVCELELKKQIARHTINGSD